MISSFFRILIASLLCALIAGCGRFGALTLANQIGIEKLRADLTALNSTPEGRAALVPETLWPDSVKRFHPTALRHQGEFGILILLSQSAEREEGLYIPFDTAFEPGEGGSGEGYEQLAPGLFWCDVKIRHMFGETRNG